MSYYDYKESLIISQGDPSFYSLVMACARKADSFNLVALERAFPETILELKARYNSPGGVLDSD
jgi:hypothetical protein